MLTLNRREALAGGLAAALLPAQGRPAAAEVAAQLQARIDMAQKGAGVLELGAGIYPVSGLKITAPLTLRGVAGRTVLQASGPGFILEINTAAQVVLDGLVLDGQGLAPQSGKAPDSQYMLVAYQCSGLRVANCTFRNARTSGVNLDACTGWFLDNELEAIGEVGLTSGRSWGQYQPEAHGARGMEISGNRLTNMGSGGIYAMHGAKNAGEDDSSIISNNTIAHVRSPRGNGPYGNGIDIYAADHVTVSGNRISNCDYGGIRVVSSRSCTVTGNMISQVADNGIFVEFALEAVVVGNNVVEDCSGGIEISGGEGTVGKFAACAGNMVRNIGRAATNPQEGPHIGIDIAAQQVTCTGNVVDIVAANEHGPGIGIYLADWAQSHGHEIAGNMVHAAPCGIGITLGEGASQVSVTGNTITAAKVANISVLKQSNYADQATRLIETTGPDLALNPAGEGLILVSGNVVLP